MGQIDQDCLVRRERPAIPADPRAEIIDAERDQHHDPLELPETSFRPLRENLLARLIERLSDLRGIDRLGVVTHDIVRWGAGALLLGLVGSVDVHRWKSRF